MSKKGKKLLIVLCGVLLIGIVVFINSNERKKELPADIAAKVDNLFLKPEAAGKIGTTRWKADVDNKTITIFVWNLTPSNEKYDGMEIDGWTLKIVEDLELKNEIKKVNATLREKFGDEAAWIISVNPRTGEKSVKVFVPSVHANQKLNNTTLDGWKIYVYQSRTR